METYRGTRREGLGWRGIRALERESLGWRGVWVLGGKTRMERYRGTGEGEFGMDANELTGL